MLKVIGNDAKKFSEKAYIVISFLKSQFGECGKEKPGNHILLHYNSNCKFMENWSKFFYTRTLMRNFRKKSALFKLENSFQVNEYDLG